MKKLSLLFLLATGLMFGISSCGDDDPEPPGNITITGIPETATIEPDKVLGPVTATVTADDGLDRLVIEKNGSNFETVDLTGTSATYDFSYDPEASEVGTNIAFKFTVFDSNGDSESVTHVLTVREFVRVTSNISENTTWISDNIYVLGGRITVLDGATLTIEPGTVIKGEAGTGANATALLVARGGMLMAEGTATAPIIFTSLVDEITPADVAAGNFGSPNLDPDLNGLWGGVIVLGRAPISASVNNADVSEIQIEGIPTTDPNGLYGGTNPADNSGVLKYISIRHGGANIGSGNEINGLSLGGVGTGTVVENIEVVANQDDGIEWFGGTVSVTNALIWNVGDDGMDTDQGWSGTMDNFIVVTPGGHLFELDGPEGSSLGDVQHTFVNGTLVANSANRNSEFLIDTDGNSGVILQDIYITGIRDGQIIDDELSGRPNVTYNNVQLDLLAETVLADYVPSGATVPSGIAAAGDSPAGADKAPFAWTWASQAGGLDDL